MTSKTSGSDHLRNGNGVPNGPIALRLAPSQYMSRHSTLESGWAGRSQVYAGKAAWHPIAGLRYLQRYAMYASTLMHIVASALALTRE